MATNESVGGQKRKTEIIAFSSGKGGTGKTLIATCLSYALTKIGLKVLVIDSDTATDGISLYLLGPLGIDVVDTIPADSTLNGILHQSMETGEFHFHPWIIHRGAKEDHGVDYSAIISGRQLYGDRFEGSEHDSSVPLDKEAYRNVIQRLFDTLREQGEYDFVIVDTRGGFSNESSDVSALADSYIVVTEADVTSFYQNRNLITYIDEAASEFNKKAVLRAIIVNKSTQFSSASNDLDLDNLESSFRLQLEREFPISYKATYPFPLSFEALTVQKSHQIPVRHALASDFSYAFFVAFQKILSVVTQPWTKEQVAEWNYLVDTVNLAIQKRNNEIQQAELAEQLQHQELENIRKANAEYEDRNKALKRELDEVHERYKRELERTDVLAAKISGEKAAVPATNSNSSQKPRRYLAPGLIGVFIVGLLITAGLFRSSFAAGAIPTASPIPTVTATLVVPTTTPVASMSANATSPATVQVVQATNTPLPTETPTTVGSPTAVLTCPPLTATPNRPDNATLIGDLNYPKDSPVIAGQRFEKKWLIQNTGKNAWNRGYVVAFGQFEQMDATTPIHFTQDVPSGACMEVSIPMTAPLKPGSHTGFWILQTNESLDSRFGFGPANNDGLYVRIIVIAPTTTVAPTP